MTILNDQQLDYITDYLNACKLNYEPLVEDLLDHICTAIEYEMDQGQTFHKAAHHVFELFNEDEIQKIQQQTIILLNQKRKLMTKISLMALLTMLLTFTTVWGIQQDPPKGSPLKGETKITSGFGMRMHPIEKKRKLHMGVDFRAPIGTPVIATSSGIVTKAEEQHTGYGNHILIQHDDEYSSVYAQLSELKVAVGDKVEKGQVIGLTGNSGASTAPHLHYEVIKNGKRINPDAYLKP